MSWHWLTRADVDKLADATQVGDENGLMSALEEPRRLAEPGDADVFDLAGSYADGILHRTPFEDRNPEMAIAIAAEFLERNGQILTRSPDVRSSFASELAEGDVDAAEIAAWLRRHSSPPAASFLVPEQDA